MILYRGREEVKNSSIECSYEKLVLVGSTLPMLIQAIVASILDGIANDALVGEVGLCGDLTKGHDDAGLVSILRSVPRQRVLGQTDIEGGI